MLGLSWAVQLAGGGHNDRRGHLTVSAADLQSFADVTPLLGDAAALRSYLVPRLLLAHEQLEMRTVMYDMSRVICSALMLWLQRCGPFQEGYAMGKWNNATGTFDFDAWMAAQQERTPGIQPAVAAALRSGIFDGQAILSLHHITRRTARSAGMAVPHGVDRTVGARRHYGGDMQQAEHMRTARERLAQLACEAGIAPTFGSSKDHEWGWAQRVDAKLPGCAAVVQTMRAEFPDVKSITMGKWWAQMVGEHIKATLGSCEARRLA